MLINLPGSSLPNGTQIQVNWALVVVLFGGFAAAVINFYFLLRNVQVPSPRLPLETPLNDLKR